MSLDSVPLHFIHLEASEGIVSNLADIPGRKSPFGARRHGACDLASRVYLGYAEFDLGIEGGQAPY